MHRSRSMRWFAHVLQRGVSMAWLPWTCLGGECGWCCVAATIVAAFALLWLLRFARADADMPTFTARRRRGHFAGKVVMITGASSGIGEQLAHVFAEDGAKLVLAARRVARLEEVKAALPTAASNVAVVQLDVEDLDGIPARAAAAVACFGRVDVLVNNAGISTRALAADISFDVVKRITTVDYLGQVALTKAILPSMLDRKDGTIVNVSSTAGKLGWTLRCAYSGAKFALIGFMDSLRIENIGNGLRVVNVCPGPVNTNVSKNALVADGSAFGVTLHANGSTGPVPKGVMSPRRCAQLMVNAAANGVDEAWICRHPLLLLMYLNQYMPSVARWILRRKAPASIDDFKRASKLR